MYQSRFTRAGAKINALSGANWRLRKENERLLEWQREAMTYLREAFDLLTDTPQGGGLTPAGMVDFIRAFEAAERGLEDK